MKLAQYLSSNDLTETAFADLIDVSQVTVNRYIRGERFPVREIILKIESTTGGQVSAADWYAPAEAAK